MPLARPAAPFLGRYSAPLLIRSRPFFCVLSARRLDGSACTVITGGEKANRARVAAAFEELQRIENLIDHPRAARVAQVGVHDGEPFVELDFAAVADGHDVIEILNSSGRRQPYGPADSLIASLRAAMSAANAVTDPRTGGPLCLGRVSLANLLFASDGEWCLFGWGRNVPVERDDGTVDPMVPYFQAPELATGGRPSPAGDFVALLLFMRSLLPWVDMSGPVGRLLRGEIGPDDLELIQCLQWVEEHMVGALPFRRATVEEAVQVSERIRVLQGTTLDEPAYAAFIRDLLTQGEEPSPLESQDPAPAKVLRLGAGAAWVGAPDGSRHRLGPSYRRLLLALVDRHAAAPSSVLTVHDLIAAGWPGESPVGDSGHNRCYVALSRLRALGLRDVIERVDEGYRLAPGTRVERAA